jgi:hypothetical protein
MPICLNVHVSPSHDPTNTSVIMCPKPTKPCMYPHDFQHTHAQLMWRPGVPTTAVSWWARRAICTWRFCKSQMWPETVAHCSVPEFQGRVLQVHHLFACGDAASQCAIPPSKFAAWSRQQSSSHALRSSVPRHYNIALVPGPRICTGDYTGKPAHGACGSIFGVLGSMQQGWREKPGQEENSKCKFYKPVCDRLESPVRMSNNVLGSCMQGRRSQQHGKQPLLAFCSGS